MSYDLILMSQPESSVPRSQADIVAAEVKAIAAIAAAACEVYPGDNAASKHDLQMMQELKSDGDFDAADFQAACDAAGLAADPKSFRCVSAYLDWIWGVHLASVSLGGDATAVKAAYAALVDYAIAHDYRLNDPQAGDDIDLEAPGKVPPRY